MQQMFFFDKIVCDKCCGTAPLLPPTTTTNSCLPPALSFRSPPPRADFLPISYPTLRHAPGSLALSRSRSRSISLALSPSRSLSLPLSLSVSSLPFLSVVFPFFICRPLPLPLLLSFKQKTCLIVWAERWRSAVFFLLLFVMGGTTSLVGLHLFFVSFHVFWCMVCCSPSWVARPGAHAREADDISLSLTSPSLACAPFSLSPSLFL